MLQLKHLLGALMVSLSFTAMAQSTLQLPKISGTIRAKYEYEPQIDKGRFEVRNTRLSATGDIIPQLSYKAEIDLSDEGKIKMLDAYARYRQPRWSVTAGQMRVPFTIDAHRSPHQQYFANRSFIAKQVGNVRDVGLAGTFKPIKHYPWTLEGGIFNGSGLTDQKDYWTSTYNYSVKSVATLLDHFTLQLSYQQAKPKDAKVRMWDVGAYYSSPRWHIEAEYLRKKYVGEAFPDVDAVDAFAAYRIPLRGTLNGVSILGRYDYMSSHSDGSKDGDGQLTESDPARQRLTGGLTLHLGGKSIYADLRINYEKYFYHHGVQPSISNQEKFVVEVMCRF